jgi:hypothetical protein
MLILEKQASVDKNIKKILGFHPVLFRTRMTEKKPNAIALGFFKTLKPLISGDFCVFEGITVL